MYGRGPKLGNYVPLLSFNNLISGIFKNFNFDFYGGKCAKNGQNYYERIVCTFLPIKMEKNMFSKIPEIKLLKLIRGT